MNIQIITKLKYIFLALILSVFVGCSLTNPSYTMKISAKTLQDNMKERFPIKKDVMIGEIQLINPKVILKNKSDRLITGLTFAYKPPFFSQQEGTLYLSGKVNYNKDKKAFFLIQPKIDEIKFNNSSLTSMVPSSMKDMMGEFIGEIFAKYPIYKIKSDSLKGKIFQKTLQKTDIKDGNLLVTFGL